MLRAFVGASLLAVFWLSTAHATVITSATSAVVDIGGEFGPGFGIGNTIDQSGLGLGYTSGVTDFDTYIGGSPLHSLAASTEWFTPLGVNSAQVTYDLGVTMTVDRIALWNEDAAGIAQFDVLFSLNGVDFTVVASNLVPTNNPINVDYLADVFAWSAQDTRFVRLIIDSCPEAGSTFDACAIGEIAFSTGGTAEPPPPGIPEPMTLVLFGSGLIGMALVRRRRMS